MAVQTGKQLRTSVGERPPPRRVLVWLAVALLVTAGAAGVWWIASGDDPATESATSAEMAVVDQWAGAMMSGDAATLAALYTEDRVWERTPIPHTLLGRASIEQALPDAFAYATTTEMTLRSAVADDGLVITEWRWSGTSSTHGRDPSDQTPFSLGAAVTFEIEDGLITRSSLYYDYEQLFN